MIPALQLPFDQIRTLLENGEYLLLAELFADADADALNLSHELQLVYVQVLAAQGHLSQAEILFEKYQLADPQVKAQIYLLAGQHDRAIQLARAADLPSIETEALISSGRFEQAKSLLLQMPINSDWYYQMGRCHGHLNHLDKSIACLERAEQLFEREGKRARAFGAASLRANYTYQCGQAKEALRQTQVLRFRLREQEIRQSPELLSNCLLNLANVYLGFGLHFSSLRLLLQTLKVLRRAPQARNVQRARLLLGYTLIEMGLARRAIDVLEKIQPQRPSQAHEKHRYMAVASSLCGEMPEALSQLEQTTPFADPKDPYRQIHFLCDQAIVNFYSGNAVQAQELFRQSMHNAVVSKNEVGLNYTRSHWAYATVDARLAEQSLAFNQQLGFRFETALDILTLAQQALRERKFAEVLRLLDLSSAFPKFPRLLGHAHLLLATSSYHDEQKEQAVFQLGQALECLKGRDLPMLKAWAARLQRCLGATDEATISIYRSTLARLPASMQDMHEKAMRAMGLGGNHILLTASASRTLDQEELAKILADSKATLIDLQQEQVHWQGQLVEGLSKYPILQKILFFLANCRGHAVSKEKLAIEALQKREYNPAVDDNLIYVHMNRLRKMFPGLKLVLSVPGGYRLTDQPDVHVVSKVG